MTNHRPPIQRTQALLPPQQQPPRVPATESRVQPNTQMHWQLGPFAGSRGFTMAGHEGPDRRGADSSNGARNDGGRSGLRCPDPTEDGLFFLDLVNSLSVVFGLLLTVDCLTNLPVIALRPRLCHPRSTCSPWFAHLLP